MWKKNIDCVNTHLTRFEKNLRCLAVHKSIHTRIADQPHDNSIELTSTTSWSGNFKTITSCMGICDKFSPLSFPLNVHNIPRSENIIHETLNVDLKGRIRPDSVNSHTCSLAHVRLSIVHCPESLRLSFVNVVWLAIHARVYHKLQVRNRNRALGNVRRDDLKIKLTIEDEKFTIYTVALFG